MTTTGPSASMSIERRLEEAERLIDFWKQEAVRRNDFVVQDLINMEGSRVKIERLERELGVARAENSQLKKDNDEVWKMMEELEEETQRDKNGFEQKITSL